MTNDTPNTSEHMNANEHETNTDAQETVANRIVDDSHATARSLDALLGMLGWNSVAVFPAGVHEDGDTTHVSKDTVVVAMTDPYPEYKTFCFMDGELHHEGSLLSMEYEGRFKDLLENRGTATIVPMAEIETVGRDENRIPEYTGDSQ